MPYKQLPIKVVDIDAISLDLLNYRTGEQENQEQALNELFNSHRRTFSVLENILVNGYVDNEIPLVIEEAGGYVVMEGNERVAALKALRDPTCIPSRLAEIRELLRKYETEASNIPESIRVEVCPNREFAIPHLARLHIGSSKDAWDLDDQARFFTDQLDRPGMTIERLQSLAPPRTSVKRYVTMLEYRKLIEDSDYLGPELRDYASGRELPLSVLEYAYKLDDIQTIIGVTINPSDGRLASIPTTAEQKEAFRRLLLAFRDEKLNTRSPQFKVGRGKTDRPEHQALLDYLSGKINRPIPLGKTDVGSGGSTVTQPTNDNASQRKTLENAPSLPTGGSDRSDSRHPHDYSTSRKTANSDNKTHLDVSDLKAIPALGENILKRLSELGRLDVNDTPIAAMLLLRVIVEISAKRYYRNIGRPFRDSVDNPVMLSTVIEKLKHDYSKQRSIKPSLDTLSARPNKLKPGSVAFFNSLAHGDGNSLVGNNVREAYQSLHALLLFLLQNDNHAASAAAK